MPRTSQYAHTAWRTQDGFFRGTPQAITQTKDGYLWIGSEGGLVRFDGVRFVPWTSPNGQKLPSNSIHALLGADDGSLWIGTSRGLAHWNNVALTNLATSTAFIEAIVQDDKSTIWITRSQIHDQDGPLCEAVADALHCHGVQDGISFPYAQPLFKDTSGSLWIGSSLGIGRWEPGALKTYNNQELGRNKGLVGVSAIAGGEGSVLVGIRRSGKGLGLEQLVDGVWKDYVVPGLDGSRLGVAALLTDRDNGLWIGTVNQGIYRVYGGHADHFGSADGLSSDSVQGFYEDKEGDLWVATAKGVDRFHHTRVISYSIQEGLTSEGVDSVLATRDGAVWMGNSPALDVHRQDKFSAITAQNGLPGAVVTSLFEDHRGRLWVGVDDGLTLYENGRFHAINEPGGKSLGVVTAIAEDVDHNIWAAVTRPALIRIQDDQVREETQPPTIPRVLSLAADSKDGIWLGLMNGSLARYRQGRLEVLPTNRRANASIRNLLVESDGSVWGATQDGAFRWKEGQEKTLTSANGLPCDDVSTLIRDNRGSLWLDTQCGFVIIDPSELDRWWTQPDVRLRVTTLDAFDGAQPGMTNFRPEASKSPDGKLWFANQNVLQVVDPASLQSNIVPPPVHVEQIIVDRKAYVPRESLRLPALSRDIEIDYTALSLVTPEKVRFRYKLEGHDADWQDPEARRQAFYSDLSPGNYRFRVIASNNDGVWNSSGATQDFTVLPAFFQTAWFRLLCFVTAGAMLWLLYILRLRQLARRMQTRFEERLEERERIARDLHDTLLQGIFSASMQLDVANNRLPEDSPAKPLVQRVIALMKQVGEEGRNALRSLRSPLPDSDNLEQALSRIRKEFAPPENVDFRVIAQGEPRPMRPVIQGEVYRIVREAIINAFRHSNARKIEVVVNYVSGNLRITVRDDGCGMDSQMIRAGRDGHWGLPGMRERAETIGARMRVMSRDKAGTEVKLWVPGEQAFESGSQGQFWSWLVRLYPAKRESAPRVADKDQKK
jgi:signal transduction histidine kinase/ligand-binding sensor domain-containing protein